MSKTYTKRDKLRKVKFEKHRKLTDEQRKNVLLCKKVNQICKTLRYLMEQED